MTSESGLEASYYDHYGNIVIVRSVSVWTWCTSSQGVMHSLRSSNNGDMVSKKNREPLRIPRQSISFKYACHQAFSASEGNDKIMTYLFQVLDEILNSFAITVTIE